MLKNIKIIFYETLVSVDIEAGQQYTLGRAPSLFLDRNDIILSHFKTFLSASILPGIAYYTRS